MSFENNDTVEQIETTEKIKEGNITKAIEFADNFSEIKITPDVQDFLNNISDQNGTIAAENRENKISLANEIPQSILEQLKGPNYINMDTKNFLKKIHSMDNQDLIKLINFLENTLISSENSEKITELDKSSKIRDIKNKIEDIGNLLKSRNPKTSGKEEIDNFPSQNERGEYNVI